jgi:hypothetical protein
MRQPGDFIDNISTWAKPEPGDVVLTFHDLVVKPQATGLALNRYWCSTISGLALFPRRLRTTRIQKMRSPSASRVVGGARVSVKRPHPDPEAGCT